MAGRSAKGGFGGRSAEGGEGGGGGGGVGTHWKPLNTKDLKTRTKGSKGGQVGTVAEE